MKQFLFIFYILFCYSAVSQKLSETDSLLIRKYYNRILPKAINSKSDVLYFGIDNALILQFPDDVSKGLKYFLKTHNGTIFEIGNGYLTIPRNAGRAFISMYVITKDADTLYLGKKEFKVLQVPIPVVRIGDIIIKDQSVIDKAIFFNRDSLKVYFTDDIKNSVNWCKVEYFNIGYSYGGVYISVDNKGAIFSKASLDLITKMRFNQDAVIKVMTISCSQIYKYLPLVRFKIK